MMPSWMTHEIKQAMLLRDNLKKTKQFQEYKKQRNKVLTLVRHAKQSYFQKLILDTDSNISRVWQALNEFTNKSRKRNTATQIPFSAEEFNNYFLSLTDSIIDDNNSNSDTHQVYNKLKDFCDTKLTESDSYFIPLLTVEDVSTLIHKLNNKKSMDIYYLNSSFLKLSLPFIVKPLTYVYNLCISTNTFPQVFKQAKVVPIPKTKDTSILDNFRPISILPILSKPLERHIHIHMMKYIEEKTLFHPFQSGFRSNHSCQTALAHLCDSWYQAINRRNMVGAVFLDLRKAFDLVNHKLLLQKLRFYFQNENTVSFFSSYLLQRCQEVSFNGTSSSPGIVKCGVPQGSILGPILFCLFINDLPLCITEKNAILELFADDSSLHTESNTLQNIENTLQDSINNIAHWCNENKMALHPHKSKSMLISTRQKQQLIPLSLNLKVLSNDIQQVHEHKVLGIIIDDELSWRSHIDKLSKKISKNLFLLNKLRHLVSPDALKLFFHAHILSHFNYASTVWCKASENQFKKLNSLHKRGLRILCSIPNLTSMQKCSYLGILPLEKQLLFNTAVFMFKINHDEAPKYLDKFFTKPDTNNRLQNFKLPFTRIDLYKHSLAFNGPSVWNSLPLQCKACQTLSSFKSILKKHLM